MGNVTVAGVESGTSVTIGSVTGDPKVKWTSGATITVNPENTDSVFTFTITAGKNVTFDGSITMPTVFNTGSVTVTPSTVPLGADGAYTFTCTNNVPSDGSTVTGSFTVDAGKLGHFSPMDPTLILNPINN